MEARHPTTTTGDELIFTLFLAAMSLPESQRADFVREACAEHPSCLAEVQRRITWESRLNGFLLTPVVTRDRMDHPFAPGDTVLRRFQILRIAGEGGMGIVYEALDEKLGHRIALKVPRFEFRKRLSPEALKSLRVTHANVCRVFEIHTEETSAGEIDFLTMEFLEGETLAVRLPRSPALGLETREGVEIVRQLCQGLAAIHAQGIVHRDLKPGNIMLSTDGGRLRAVIMDFGIAQACDIFASQARGTPAYLAPELWKGQAASVQSDLYALGVLFYEMASGRRPFADDAHWEDRLRAEPDLPDLREPLRSAISKCLHPDPARRFQSTLDLAEALRPRPRRWLRGASAAMAASLIAGLLANGGFSPLALSAVHRQLPRHLEVAVLPFRNVDRNAASQAFCESLPEAVANALAAMQPFHAGMRVAPASEVRSRSVDTPARARRDLGVNLAIAGDVRRRDSGVQLELRLVDTASSLPITSLSLFAPASDPYLLQTETIQRVATLLNLDQGPPPSDTAYDLYSQALLNLERYDKKGNIDAAITLLKKAVNQDPAYTAAYASLSEAYWRRYRETRSLPDRGDALQMGLRATQLDVRVASGHVNLGRVYATTGDYQKAIAEYREALRLDPLASAASQELAGVLADQGRVAEAQAAYVSALRLRPDDWSLLTSAGIFYWAHGRYREAGAAFSHIVDLMPDNQIAHRNLADNLFSLGQYEEAAVEAQRSIALRPNYTAYVLLANIQYAKGNYPEAVRLGRQALTFGTAAFRAGPLTSLANACRFDPGSKGDAPGFYLKAIQILDHTIAVNPRDGVAYSVRALDRAKIDDPRGAAADAANALRFAPQDVEVLTNVAEVRELGRHRAQALDDILRALKAGYPLVRIQDNPEFRSLRQDPRFTKAITRIGETHAAENKR